MFLFNSAIGNNMALRFFMNRENVSSFLQKLFTIYSFTQQVKNNSPNARAKSKCALTALVNLHQICFFHCILLFRLLIAISDVQNVLCARMSFCRSLY